MRRLSVGVVCLALSLAACGGSDPAKNPSLAAGVTTEPTSTTSTTAVAAPAGVSTTTAPAGSTTTAAAPPPAGTSTSAAAGGGACSPNGPSLKVVAAGVQFNTKCLAAPAGQPFTIAFDNQDPGTPHNVAIFSADPASHSDAKVLFRGAVTTGPNKTTYQVDALAAGNAFFHCDVHPTTMLGAFVVR